MNVASLELCKELCNLSSWGDDTDYVYYANAGQHSGSVWHRSMVFDKPENLPAYDLGYLLRKLQNDQFDVHVIAWKTNDYSAACYEIGEVSFDYPDADADTPEDAACKLAIELFKQGILTSEAKAS